MLGPIGLNNKARAKADEIDDVITNLLLPLELPAAKPLASQQRP